jgi:hypothetical protein
MKKVKRLSLLLFLFSFLSITLFVNFFHTEPNFKDTDTCPACHFLKSSFTTSQIHFFHLPPPAANGLLEDDYFFTYIQNTFITPLSRSPPSA